MNMPIKRKNSPEVKSWVRRVVEAAGVYQAREALPCFHKGIEDWSIAAPFCLLHAASRSGCLTGIEP